MKTLFISLFFVFPHIFSWSNNSHAQSFRKLTFPVSSNQVTNIKSINNTGFDKTKDPKHKDAIKEMRRSLKEARANYRTTSYFTSNFANASKVKWSKENNLTTASFVLHDGIYSFVVFDRKGNFVHSVINYYEAKLNPQIKKIINQEYEGYSIVLVQEVTTPEAKVYKLNLENEDTIRQVVVSDNTYEVFDFATYKKGH